MDVRDWKNAVAGLGCGLCRRLGYGETPAELHHPRDGVGKAQRASDWLVIPLCPEHHRGSKGWHGTRDEFKRHNINEWDILAETIELVVKQQH